MTRRGVTLLEVLFAIGITAIGILGVTMTLVLASKQATDGHVSDMADRLGRNAVREIAVRGYDRPSGDQGTWTAVPVNGQAYCLDPLGIAVNPTVPDFNFFPAYNPLTTPGPRMYRISVRAMPGNQAVSPMPPIRLEMARLLFLGNDDLVFLTPDDRTMPPVQKYSGALERRETTGVMSWFATFQSSDYQQRTALMHVVVCYRRVPEEVERLLSTERIDGEDPTVPAVINPAEPRGQVFKAGGTADDLKIKEREWIMVAGQRGTMNLFHWYRVLSVSSILPAGTPDAGGFVYPVDTRDVTVFGRDWPLQRTETQIIVPGHVVGVYEKTAQLNHSGMWK